MSRRFRFTRDTLNRLKQYQQGKKEHREEEHMDKRVESKPFVVVSRTDIGKVRATNQDAVIETDRLFGVADGMGGHQGGETASAGARDALVELLDGKEPAEAVLEEAIREVNRRLFAQQKEDEKLSGMGTTLSVVWKGEKKMLLGHVGDSRIYLLRSGVLRQMTNDHSLVEELVRAGMLSKAQARCHPMKNVITRAVGTEEGVEVDVMSEERQKGDTWLICTDGLHGQLLDSELEGVLSANDPATAADLLLDAALQAGGQDNITLLILRDEEGAQ